MRTFNHTLPCVKFDQDLQLYLLADGHQLWWSHH